MAALRYSGYWGEDFILPNTTFQLSLGKAGSPESMLTKTPPSPVIQTNPSRLDRALGVYNGWISFDSWLNSPDVTWSKLYPVIRILSEQPARARVYLEECGLPANVKTAGYLYGKAKSMEAICLIRELYFGFRQGIFSSDHTCHILLGRLSRFLFPSMNVRKVVQDIEIIALSSKSLDEFELRWFSGFCVSTTCHLFTGYLSIA